MWQQWVSSLFYMSDANKTVNKLSALLNKTFPSFLNVAAAGLNTKLKPQVVQSKGLHDPRESKSLTVY